MKEARELTDRERYTRAINYIADSGGNEPRHCGDILGKAVELLTETKTNCPDDIWLSVPAPVRRAALGLTATSLKTIANLDQQIHSGDFQVFTNPQELVDKMRSIGAREQADAIKKLLIESGETIDGETKEQ